MSIIEQYLDAVSRYYSTDERPYKYITIPQVPFQNLTDTILHKGSRIVLLGPPGSGKTTCLDWAMMHAAKDRNFVPIFLSLRNYCSTLNDLLRVSTERFISEEGNHLLNSLKIDDILPAFLLDGYDEVPAALRVKMDDEIFNLSDQNSESPIVVTSRNTSVVKKWEGWNHLNIPELTDKQIEAFLQQTPENKQLLNVLYSHDDLHRLARLPLFLSTISYAWTEGDNFRDVLMREIPRYTAWRGHTLSLLPSSVNPIKINLLLELVALELAIRNTNKIDYERLTELAMEVVTDTSQANALSEAVMATKILAMDQVKSITFSHKTYIESYAARAIASRLKSNKMFIPELSLILEGAFASGVASNLITILSDAELDQLLELASKQYLYPLFELGREALAVRKVTLPSKELSGASRIASVVKSINRFADNQDSARRDILVIAVHGFNTRGDWKNELGLELTRATDGERFLYRAWDYGRFVTGIFNPFSRSQQVKKFHIFFNDLIGKFPVRPEICVVAHSFGTYIIGHALRRFPEVAFDRILFLGSALPKSFNWVGIHGRCGMVLNISGGSDVALMLTSFLPGLGDAGKNGFIHGGSTVHQVTEQYSDHSDLFGVEYMKSVWLPFLADGTLPLSIRPKRALGKPNRVLIQDFLS